ncbi:MAG: proton-conducting transporter membrane subunit [Chloroflexota bacterium]
MEGLLNLAWVVPIPPFLAFLAIVLFLNSNKTASALTAIGGVLVTWLISWPIAFYAFSTEHFSEHPLEEQLYTIPTGWSSIGIGFQVDGPNALMLFMVSFLLVMIFVYASGYMTFPPHLREEDYPEAAAQGKDPRYSRFMAYISLFATGMMGLVVANSLITFFVFWEIMGLCSYLLIGFWYEKGTARAACMKAFMTTRIGDAIMLIGMLLLYARSEPSSLMFHDILSPENLEHLAHMTIWLPFFGTVNLLGAIVVLIFFGTIGKSAQFPLHVWLPDAMEGPTPVSAMIHAATMVSAGVFLIVRLFPMFAEALHSSPDSMQFVAFIGGFTAIFAATIAVAQWDIKRVLAYSTISQLGFMVAALGTGSFIAALFHLITHAFFKALLFLGSGSVIHGVEHGLHHVHAHGHGDDHGNDHNDSHGHHGATIIKRPDGNLDPEDPQDMRNMGGLLSRMPLTGWTFIIGGLALSGFPLLTAGFWSKDEILAVAWYNENTTVFWTLAIAAFLTAFYTARQICLTFLGSPRTEMAEHAPESVPQMTIPLVLIAPFAIALGWFGIPASFPVLGGIVPNWLEHFIEGHIEYHHFHVPHPSFDIVPLLVSLGVALGGLLVGYLVYGKGMKEGEIDPLRRVLGPIWHVLHNKYWIDEIYNGTIILLTLWLTRISFFFDNKWVIDPVVNGIAKIGVWTSVLSAAVDKWVVDGFVNSVAGTMQTFGDWMRSTQDGRVQGYLMVVTVVMMVWLLLKAMPILLTLV